VPTNETDALPAAPRDTAILDSRNRGSAGRACGHPILLLLRFLRLLHRLLPYADGRSSAGDPRPSPRSRFPCYTQPTRWLSRAAVHQPTRGLRSGLRSIPRGPNTDSAQDAEEAVQQQIDRPPGKGSRRATHRGGRNYTKPPRPAPHSSPAGQRRRAASSTVEHNGSPNDRRRPRLDNF
jgi:hypothetical protein